MSHEHKRFAELAQKVRKTAAREGTLLTGTNHPAGVPTGYTQYRSDLGFFEFFDGTRWLSTHEYVCVLGLSDSVVASYTATTANVRLGVLRSDYQVYCTRGEAIPFVGATNSNINFITYNINDNTAITLWTFSTALDTPSTNSPHTTSVFTQPGGLRTFLTLNLVVTGAPAAQFPRVINVFYRLIIP